MRATALKTICFVLLPALALATASVHDYSQYTHWEKSFLTNNDQVASVVAFEALGSTYFAAVADVAGVAFYALNNGEMEEVGSLGLAGAAEDVVVDNGVAYIVSSPNRIAAVGAFFPALPQMMWDETIPHAPVGVAMMSPYVLIACADDGLLVYDPNLSFGIPIGVIGSWTGVAQDVQVSGTNVIILTGTGVSKLDLSDPANPTLIDSLATAFPPLSLAVSGDEAYVGQDAEFGGTSQITEVDVSDPLLLSVVREFTGVSEEDIDALVVSNDVLLAVGHRELIQIDLVAGTVVWTGVGEKFSTAVAHFDDRIAVSSRFEGVHIYLQKSVGSPPTSATFGMGGHLREIKIVGDFLYGHAAGTLYCFDLRPIVPQLAWTYEQPNQEFITSAFVAEDQIYLGSLNGVVDVLSYTELGATLLVEFSISSSNVIDFGRLGDHLAVLADPIPDGLIHATLYVVDLTIVTQPVVLDQYNNDDFPNMIAYDNTVVLWDNSFNANGIQLIDATDPTDLTESALLPTLPLSRVTRGGDFIYGVATSTLQPIDISDIDIPGPEPIQTAPEANLLVAVGSTGYLTKSDLVYDLSDPAAPRPMGSITSNAFKGAVVVAASDDYLIAGSGTLFVLMGAQGTYVSDVEDELLPARALGLRATPNPFNPRVRLEFAMSTTGYAAVDIYDLRGRRVAQLGGEFSEQARAAVDWDGKDDGGRDLPSGVYLVRVIANDKTETSKIVLAR
ncbi:MAG: hypothetical protein ACI9UK_001173 [Candidatus Krumholzibacteriia bacterium]|jgi:hypothetical protein